MSAVSFRIPGTPVGKARARATVRGFKDGRPIIGHHTPQKTRTWEGVAATMAMQAMAGTPPMAGPLRLELQIVLPVPTSWPGWKRALALAGEIRPTVKPDADNVEKAAKDALNGVVWADDVQVVEGAKHKVYGLEPGVTVTVTPLSAHAAQLTRKPTR